jgi:hypothetical protein
MDLESFYHQHLFDEIEIERSPLCLEIPASHNVPCATGLDARPYIRNTPRVLQRRV